jgi:hypothetical protein
MPRTVLAGVMAVLLGAAGVAAGQGLIHIYVWNGSGYSKGGSMPSGQESSMAIVCKSGNCRPRETCDTCHTGTVAAGPYANQELHEREFARRALRVGSTPVAFGTEFLRREGTQMVLTRASGARIATLPGDAFVLPDRTGRPAFVVYRGDQPPRP